jgi:hypothetical protein
MSGFPGWCVNRPQLNADGENSDRQPTQFRDEALGKILHLLAAIVKIPISDSSGFHQNRRQTNFAGFTAGCQRFGVLRDWLLMR